MCLLDLSRRCDLGDRVRGVTVLIICLGHALPT